MAKRKELVTDAMHEFGLLTTSRKQQIENCQPGIPSMKRRYHLLHISQKINERTTIKAREQEKNRQLLPKQEITHYSCSMEAGEYGSADKRAYLLFKKVREKHKTDNNSRIDYQIMSYQITYLESRTVAHSGANMYTYLK